MNDLNFFWNKDKTECLLFSTGGERKVSYCLKIYQLIAFSLEDTHKPTWKSHLCGTIYALSRNLRKDPAIPASEVVSCLGPVALRWRHHVKHFVRLCCLRTATKRRQRTSRNQFSTPLLWAFSWSPTPRCIRKRVRFSWFD